MATKVQETVTRMFIEKIEERRANGETVAAPWRKLWNPALGADRNLITGKAYRGSNVFMTAVQGYASPFWITRKQLAKVGGSVKLSATETRFDKRTGTDVPAELPYTPILYWWFPDPANPAHEGRMPFCKFYQVWNVEQCNGIEELVAEAMEGIGGNPVNPIEEAQAIVDGFHGPTIRHGDSRAYYTPSSDTVTMPEMAAFESAEAYYSTMFHELAHSTGHRTRLNRDGVVNPVRFASHDYSEEELIAEMTAAMVAGAAGIETPETVENSAAYLDHWLAKLKREPAWLATAGSAAQKAADLIRGIKWEKAKK